MPTVTDLTSSGTTPIPVPWVHHIDGRFCVGHWVCDRPACVEDAKEWARAHHYGEPVVIPRGGG